MTGEFIMNEPRRSIRAILAQLNAALIPITQSVIRRKQEQLMPALPVKQLSTAEQLAISALFKQDKE
jgi:hypothetical protein